jgi:TldD protein
MKNEMIKKLSVAFIAIFLAVGSVFANMTDLDKEIIRAMEDEISRSMDQLHLESLERPYYIEYKLIIEEPLAIGASLGSIKDLSDTKRARIYVQVRVGDYKFDNTNFFDFGLSLFGSGDDEERFAGRQIPYEIDYTSLRRNLWLATDAAYKQSAEILSKKQAAIKNRIRKDTTHDYLKIDPEKHLYSEDFITINKDEYKKKIKDISRVFADYPEVTVSSVGFEFIPEKTYYLNSEGRQYIRTDHYTGLEIVAFTQAEDGMPLAEMYSAIVKKPQELPSRDSLLSAAKIVAKGLTDLKAAPYQEESYSGPIIFEGQAAAEVFAMVFAPNLVTQRPPMTEGGMQESDRYMAFQTKIGGRVLPEFFDVWAEPELTKFRNTPLVGSFEIDDEGVIPEKVELVRDGYLKNLLSTRTPTKRVRSSNGHNRGGAAMLSVINISADDEHSKSEADLKKRMMELCEDRELPYGIVVKKILDQNILYTSLFRITGGSFPMVQIQTKLPIIQAYKVFPDGREELIRGAQAYRFTTQSFKDIILAGNEKYAMNYLAPAVTSPFVTGGKQYLGTTIITPDLLFEDGEINIFEDDFPKPPLYPAPSVTGK